MPPSSPARVFRGAARVARGNVGDPRYREDMSERPEWLTTLGVFDLETTGVDVHRDRIVTAHVGLLDSRGHALGARSWLADPGVEIPDGAAAVHGITTLRARAEGRPAAEVVAEIRDTLAELFAREVPVVAYNASFDFSLLRAECERHGIAPLDPRPVIDPLVIDKSVDRYRRGKRTLDLVAAHYGVTLEGAHEASADAEAAGRVALALAARFPSAFGSSAAALHDAQIDWAREQAESLSEYFHRIGKLAPGEQLETAWPVREAPAPSLA